MNADTFNRLHALRMENDQAGFDMAEMAPRFERMRERHANGSAPRAVAVHQLFQTPAEIAAQLVALLDMKPGQKVLEPSAGLGRILDALQPYQPGEVVAVEMAPDCSGELFRQDRASVTIKQRDFLTLTPADIGTFDAVAMNPPFTMRADIRHIKHALQFVKPGGKLAAICMNMPNRWEVLQQFTTRWIPLPGNSFKHEGTRVDTAMILIEKQ